MENWQTGKLDYPPTINKYWQTRIVRHAVSGKISKFVTRAPKVQKYCEDQVYFLKSQNLKPILAKSIRLELYVYPPDDRRRDLDNIVKAVQDCLQAAGVFDDDFKISQLYVERREIVKGGLVKFNIKGVDNVDKA